MIELKIKHKSKGFTIIELIVVVLVIGILIAVAFPVFTDTIATAENKACQANTRIIEGAVKQYYMGYGKYPSTLQDLVTSAYLTSLPDCPEGGKYSFDKNSGEITCTITSHN